VVRRSRGFKRSRCAPTLHVCNHTQTLSNVMIMRRPSFAHSRWLHTCQIAKQGEKRPPSQPLLHTQVEGVRDQAACVRGENVCPTRLAPPRGDLRRRLFAGQSSAVPGRSAGARVEWRQLLLPRLARGGGAVGTRVVVAIASSSGGGGGAGVGGGGGGAGVGGCDASTVRCRMGNGSGAVLARRVDGAQAGAHLRCRSTSR
jgi:hypothetical protein